MKRSGWCTSYAEVSRGSSLEWNGSLPTTMPCVDRRVLGQGWWNVPFRLRAWPFCLSASARRASQSGLFLYLKTVSARSGSTAEGHDNIYIYYFKALPLLLLLLTLMLSYYTDVYLNWRKCFHSGDWGTGCCLETLFCSKSLTLASAWHFQKMYVCFATVYFISVPCE